MRDTAFYTALSKELSYALRHQPWKYELELDAEGWVPVAQLLATFSQSEKWQDISLEDIQQTIFLADKKRHELLDHRIRALYGHSTPMKINKEEAIPPKRLYHGTSPKLMKSIRETGLLPMSRQYVHLSEDRETAWIVGKRKAPEPVIVWIDTEAAATMVLHFIEETNKYGLLIISR